LFHLSAKFAFYPAQHAGEKPGFFQKNKGKGILYSWSWFPHFWQTILHSYLSFHYKEKTPDTEGCVRATL